MALAIGSGATHALAVQVHLLVVRVVIILVRVLAIIFRHRIHYLGGDERLLGGMDKLRLSGRGLERHSRCLGVFSFRTA